jgi:hypothetical protein
MLILNTIQCDEVHPRCGACARHSVSCEYPPKPARSLPDTSSRAKHRHLDRKSSQDHPMPDAGEVEMSNHQNHVSQELSAGLRDEMLELQLMHEVISHPMCTF